MGLLPRWWYSYVGYTVGTIYNAKIDNNQAGSNDGGGGMHIYESDLTMKNKSYQIMMLVIMEAASIRGDSTMSPSINHHLSIMMQLIMVMKYIHMNHQPYH